jgi:hypothetical protein
MTAQPSNWPHGNGSGRSGSSSRPIERPISSEDPTAIDDRSGSVNTPKIVGFLVLVALTFAPASNPCQAGSITYNFVEGSGAPNPGEVGATMTLNSPPASATSSWSITNASDISNLQIIDSALFPTGFTGALSSGLLEQPLVSASGARLDSGVLVFNFPPTLVLITTFGSSETGFFTAFTGNEVVGIWAVPEPDSAVLAGIASAIGLALAAFRKRKEAHRQRPVGPLHANQ